MLPDDYLRKMKQDLAEADQLADSATHLEPDPEQSAESQRDDAPPPRLPGLQK
jgi:hypothetical protein